MTPMEAVEGGKPGEWIEHDGKGMPVDGCAVVDIKFRSPIEPIYDGFKASHWAGNGPADDCWLFSKDSPENDIVAYRVVKP